MDDIVLHASFIIIDFKRKLKMLAVGDIIPRRAERSRLSKLQSSIEKNLINWS